MARIAQQYLALPSPNSTPNTPSIIPPPPAKRAKRSRFHRLSFALLGLLPTLTLLALELWLCLRGITFSATSSDYGCDPEGAVWVTNANRPNLWGKSYGLAITLGFGAFEYSQAKSIDVAWDLIVGRGCQVLGVGVLYYVFRGPVVEAMRWYEVPYEKVLKMEYNTGGISAMGTYFKDVSFSGRSAYHRFVAWMLAISTLYVVLVPTWISAMSGYQPVDVPLLQVSNGTYIPFADLDRCAYVIADGPRIGLDAFACVPEQTPLYYSVVEYLTTYIPSPHSAAWTANSLPPSAANITSAITINGEVHDLKAPVLNITANNFELPTQTVFFNGQFYDADYLTKQGMCAPQKIYRWGFSLDLLFMFLSVTLLLSVFLYVVWVRHFWSLSRSSEGDDTLKVFGDLRTTLAVSQAIRLELGEEVAGAMTDEGLKRALKRRGAGLRLRSGWQDDQKNLQELQLKPVASSRTSSLTVGDFPRMSRTHSEVSFV